MVPVVLYLGLAGTVLYTPVGPLVPALDSYWLKIHVAAAVLSRARSCCPASSRCST